LDKVRKASKQFKIHIKKLIKLNLMQTKVISSNDGMSRRKFMAKTATAMTVFSILPSPLISQTGANSKINLGLIGCGGRGQWIADLFLKTEKYNLVAVADYFKDRTDEAANRFSIPENKRFNGIHGYKKLLELKEVEAVAIETPPYFHPEQAANSIEAGKHVYLAKPIAVDVWGCNTVESAAKKATANNLCFLVDFQTRANASYKECVRRVHNGDIGKILLGEATYITGPTWGHMDKYLRQNPNNVDARIRAWGLDAKLSGDVIVEQNIHAIDVATWFLNAAPIKAVGSCFKKREFLGDCHDAFSVIFHFPDNILVSFWSKQNGAGWDDILCRIYGTQGTADTHYFGTVKIIGDEPYDGGRLPNLYTDGAVENIKTFYKNITEKDFSNPTVPPSVRSNLTAILGREACFRTKQSPDQKFAEITWDELIKSNQKYSLDFIT
jgi:predicted dehydrogenase